MGIGEYAARVAVLLFLLFVFLEGVFYVTTIQDRGERWHCARYRAES